MMQIRWRSTPASAEAGEVSAFAVIETAVLSAVALYVAVAYDILRHITISALIAPFLMLRTEEATRIGLRWFKTVWDKQSKLAEDRSVTWALSLPIVMGLFGIVARAGSITGSLCRHPIAALMAVPSNWRKLALATDLLHPPEIVPGAELDSGLDEDAKFSSWVKTFKEWSIQGPTDLIAFLWFVVDGALIFVPTALYRLSFKSTAIVWLPLIWIAKTSLDKGLELKVWLQQIAKDDQIEQTRRRWSAIVLGLLTVKILYIAGWVTVESLLDKIPEGKLRAFYIVPNALPPWQFASALNAVLTFVLLAIASSALPRISMTPPRWEKRTELGVKVTTFARSILSLYSIAAVLYIFVVETFHLSWPQLGTKLLPFVK